MYKNPKLYSDEYKIHLSRKQLESLNLLKIKMNKGEYKYEKSECCVSGNEKVEAIIVQSKEKSNKIKNHSKDILEWLNSQEKKKYFWFFNLHIIKHKLKLC